MKTTATILVLVFVWLLAGCAAQSTRSTEPDRASDLNLQLGIDALRKGDLSRAKERIERSLGQNPRNAHAHSVAGLLYERLNEPRKARSHFERAVSLEPKNSEILNNYAVYLCQKGLHERGEKMALRAAGNPLYQTPDVAFVNAGTCARGAGNNERAEAHFRKALSIDPRQATALVQMAEVEYAQANYLAARGFLERYLAVGRNDPATLLLGMRIEQRLGNSTAANGYAERLKSEFPKAAETRELLEAERNSG